MSPHTPAILFDIRYLVGTMPELVENHMELPGCSYAVSSEALVLLTSASPGLVVIGLVSAGYHH
jgi:phosphoribosylaminoimidazole (AIR) synthetase